MKTLENMEHRFVEESLSRYIENDLLPRDAARVADHLAHCAVCQREEQELRALLNLLHGDCVPREPSLDIWAELAPKVAQVVAEERLGVWDRVRQRGQQFRNAVSAGAILWTQALAMNTQTRLQRHLLIDPFHLHPAGEEA